MMNIIGDVLLITGTILGMVSFFKSNKKTIYRNMIIESGIMIVCSCFYLAEAILHEKTFLFCAWLLFFFFWIATLIFCIISHRKFQRH